MDTGTLHIHPYLNKLLRRNNGQQFTKRVVFDHSHYENLLGQIVDAREQKRHTDSSLRTNKLNEEKGEIDKHRQRITQEMHNEQKDKEIKKNAFREANQLLMYEKELKRQRDNHEKSIERVDFFPFMHGDSVEQHRQILEQLNAADLVETIRQKKEKETDEHTARQIKQAQLNREANEMMLVKPEPLKVKDGQEKATDYSKTHCTVRSNRVNTSVYTDQDGSQINPSNTSAMDIAMARH